MIYCLMSLLLILLIIIVIFSFKLRKFNKASEKLPSYLNIFWGLASYLYDKGIFLISRFSIPYRITSSKIFLYLRHIYPGENILFHYERLIISCLCHFLMAYCVGAILITGLFINTLSPVKVSKLTRPNFSSGEDIKNISVSLDDGSSTDLNITIKPKKLSNSEILSIFDSLYDEIETSLLGENKHLNHIDRKLNFIFSISNNLTGNFSVTIDWSVSDNSLINYNGELIYENINKSGSKAVVYATMQLEKYDFTATKEFPVILYPMEKNTSDILEEEINMSINGENKLNDTTVFLPKDSSLGKLTFYEKSENFPIIIFPLFIIILFLIVFIKISDLRSRALQRNAQLLHDYPEIVSKLTLLYCAGLNIQNSFRRIDGDYVKYQTSKRYAYEEIKIMLKSIDNGTNEAVAYKEFGHSCVHPCYIKLGTLLSQNLKRGSGEIYSLLEYEAMNSLQDKKTMIKIAGEKASTKALLPMVLLLLTVFIMIIAPAFMSM